MYLDISKSEQWRSTDRDWHTLLNFSLLKFTISTYSDVALGTSLKNYLSCFISTRLDDHQNATLLSTQDEILELPTDCYFYLL